MSIFGHQDYCEKPLEVEHPLTRIPTPSLTQEHPSHTLHPLKNIESTGYVGRKALAIMATPAVDPKTLHHRNTTGTRNKQTTKCTCSIPPQSPMIHLPGNTPPFARGILHHHLHYATHFLLADPQVSTIISYLRDHLATARATLEGLGDLLAGCSWVPRGNSILHVHSFTFVLMSSSSTPSSIRQLLSRSRRTAAAREQATDYADVFKRVNERLLIALPNVAQGTAPHLPDKMTDSSLGPFLPGRKRNLAMGTGKGVISLPSIPPAPPPEYVKLLTSHTATALR
eukprot:sb/3467805/